MGYKDDEKRITISFSELKTYIECPFKHKLKYFDNHKEPDAPVLAYGRAVHLGVQKLWETDAKTAQKIFREQIRKEYAENFFKITDEIDKGDLLIYEVYKHELHKIKNLGIELLLDELLFEDDNIYFKGFIDLVLESKDNKIIIADLKTTERGWNQYKRNDFTVRMQLYLYKYFYAKKYNVPYSNIDLQFILLCGETRSMEIFTLNHSDSDITMAYDIVLKVIENIYKDGYFPKNLKSCTYCHFNNKPELCDRKTNILKV